MAFDYSDIPSSVYDDSIREQLGGFALDDSNPRFYNFVCPNPECGDMSRPNEKKAYIYTDTWRYVCFKCTPMCAYATWLKRHDDDAYRRLIFQAFGSDRQPKKTGIIKPADVKVSGLPFKEGEIIPITVSHPVAEAGLAICKARRVREEVYSEWFVCLPGEQFYDRDPKTGQVILDENGHPCGNKYRNRIIMPFYHFGGKWEQFDARAIDPKNPLRYYNFAGVRRTAYNIDFINYDEPIYILEGTMDSTFIRNSIAIGGIPHFREIMADNPRLEENKSRIVMLWDNDEKGREARLETCRRGLRWFDWTGIKSKDINEAVLTGELPVDDEGFVADSALRERTREAEGSEILFTLKYGNMKKEATRQKFDGIRKYKEQRNNKRRAEVFF